MGDFNVKGEKPERLVVDELGGDGCTDGNITDGPPAGVLDGSHTCPRAPITNEQVPYTGAQCGEARVAHSEGKQTLT